MNPKENATKLYERFYYLMPAYLNDKDQDITATFCAKACVDEIINALDIYPTYQLKEYEIEQLNHWKEVRKEIENL